MNTTKRTTPDDIIIEPRQPDFDFTDVPCYWLRDPFTSHFMNALSVFVPYSERMVIEIIRKHKDSISDPRLLQDIEGLFKQEGRHALIHIHCNKMLVECGYSAIPIFEKIQKLFVNLVCKISPAMWELAIPAAFEHFTSAISREFISNKAGWAGEKSNEAVNFTNWHALEELEHQAVCYDVFKALGNRGWVVTSILLFCWIPATIIPIYSVQLYLLFKDKILLKPRNWIPYCRFIWKSFPMLARGALKYLSKSYRPWNTADQSLYRMHLKKMGPVLEKWKVLQENQKDNVSEK